MQVHRRKKYKPTYRLERQTKIDTESTPIHKMVLYHRVHNRRNVRQPIKSMNGYTVMQSNHIKPEVNYREFRLHNVITAEFSEVWVLV